MFLMYTLWDGTFFIFKIMTFVKRYLHSWMDVHLQLLLSNPLFHYWTAGGAHASSAHLHLQVKALFYAGKPIAAVHSWWGYFTNSNYICYYVVLKYIVSLYLHFVVVFMLRLLDPHYPTGPTVVFYRRRILTWWSVDKLMFLHAWRNITLSIRFYFREEFH